jgi:type I restriction enzyme R subunit
MSCRRQIYRAHLPASEQTRVKKEAQARIRINRLLEQSGGRFFPNHSGPDNLICECHISKKNYVLGTDFGDDFEKTIHGFPGWPGNGCWWRSWRRSVRWWRTGNGRAASSKNSKPNSPRSGRGLRDKSRHDMKPVKIRVAGLGCG